MNVELIIFLVEVLAVVGFSAYDAKNIIKDLKRIHGIATIIPIAVFGFSLVIPAATGDPAFFDNFTEKFMVLIYGILAGYVASPVTAMITQLIKKIIKKIKS